MLKAFGASVGQWLWWIAPDATVPIFTLRTSFIIEAVLRLTEPATKNVPFITFAIVVSVTDSSTLST
jgi:hypothetical protein